MTSGVGFGWLLTQLPMLEDIARLGGAVFALVWQSVRAQCNGAAVVGQCQESRVFDFAYSDSNRFGFHLVKPPCVFGYGGADWEHRRTI